MKKLLIIFIMFLVGFSGAYFLISARTDTFTGRWLAWKSSDIDDYQLFPSRPIANAPPVFNFQPGSDAAQFEPITYHYREEEQSENLESLLAATETTAFIVIKDDKILYEGYFNSYGRDSINTSFSIAKSVTSLMVGAAIDEGVIASLQDPVTGYIPELLQTDPRYQHITLEHLLSMKSGIAFKDTDIPWHDKSRAYYHPQLRQVVLNLPITTGPDEVWVYNTFNPVILGIVLERATGQTVDQYFAGRFWQRLGMEFDASWSIDSEADGMVKMESGLNARAIDFAKIGRLILNKGNWNGEQIVSSAWVEDSMRIDPVNAVSKLGENIYYQNGWWIQAATPADLYVVYGWGHRGQYLFIFPDENMIVARFGKDIGQVDSWREIAQEVVRQVSP